MNIKKEIKTKCVFSDFEKQWLLDQIEDKEDG